MRRSLLIALIVAIAAPAHAQSSCPGSGGQAICESAAESDLGMYLWLDLITMLITASDTVLAFGEEPTRLAVHPINIVHHLTAGMTILAGELGRRDGSFSELAQFTFALGLTSEAFAIVDTITIAVRSHKRRRIERRIESGR